MTKDDLQRMFWEGTLTWEQMVTFVEQWLLSGDPENMEVRYTCQQLAEAWREEMS